MAEEKRKPTKQFLTEVAIEMAGKAVPILEEAAKDLLKYSRGVAEEKLGRAKEKAEKGKNNEPVK